MNITTIIILLKLFFFKIKELKFSILKNDINENLTGY